MIVLSSCMILKILQCSLCLCWFIMNFTNHTLLMSIRTFSPSMIAQCTDIAIKLGGRWALFQWPSVNNLLLLFWHPLCSSLSHPGMPSYTQLAKTSNSRTWIHKRWIYSIHDDNHEWAQPAGYLSVSSFLQSLSCTQICLNSMMTVFREESEMRNPGNEDRM